MFVDHQLRIARFTPAATQVINFIASDVGRPLENVVSNFVVYDRMVDDTQAVLDTLVPKEAEVQVKGGMWYLMRIRPYRTLDNLIEGAVITLVDISERKKAEEALQRSEERLSKFINQAYAGVSEIDLEGRLLFANDRLCEMLGYTRDELLGRHMTDITAPGDLAGVQAQFQAAAADGSDVQTDKRYVRADGTRIRTHERVSALRGPERKAPLAAGGFVRSQGPAGRPPLSRRGTAFAASGGYFPWTARGRVMSRLSGEARPE
ncbi:MAG: PAS domain-containing protein [Burkholderiaceae bacterium]|nr:PAS domain-containing protein [Burkholderiaceae bacterium]